MQAERSRAYSGLYQWPAGCTLRKTEFRGRALARSRILLNNITVLHGFTGHPDDFEALQECMPNFSLHGPVLFGHDSIRPSLSVTQAWDGTADEVGQGLLPGSVLLGYSMGGRVALQVAVRYPARIAALILVGATPGIADPVQRASRRASDEALASRIETIPLGQFLSEWSQKPVIASQHNIPAPHRSRMQARKRRLLPAGLAASLRGIGTGSMPSLWDCLPSVPTLLLTGEQDRKFTAIAARMATQMRHADHHVVAGVGHCAHLEGASAVAAAVERFLSGVSSLR